MITLPGLNFKCSTFTHEHFPGETCTSIKWKLESNINGLLYWLLCQLPQIIKSKSKYSNSPSNKQPKHCEGETNYLHYISLEPAAVWLSISVLPSTQHLNVQSPTPPGAGDITAGVYFLPEYSWPGVMERCTVVGSSLVLFTWLGVLRPRWGEGHRTRESFRERECAHRGH